MALDVRQLIQPQSQGIAGALGRGLATQQAFQQVGQQQLAAQREAQVRQALAGGQPSAQPPGLGMALPPPMGDQPVPPPAGLGEQPTGLGAAVTPPAPPPPTQEEKIEIARTIDPEITNRIIKELGLDDASKRAEASRFASDLENTPFSMRREKIEARIQKLRAEGRDPTQTEKLLGLDEATQNRGLLGIQLADLSTKERFGVRERAAREAEIPAGQREFEALTEKLTPEQKKSAALIKLGLEPRAVGSAIQTISDKGIAEEVGDASATIKQREKFGELTGASRAKSIDKGFDQIVRINKGINTIDRAISTLEAGAKTGAIERFLPSMRAASVELENIRNQFALDVIGGVTLGAISEAELALAKQVGLPEGLDEPELIEHLKQRRTAQEKLRAYYQKQINHLDQGGTVASFLRQEQRGQDVPRETLPAEQEEVPAAAQQPAQVIRFDAQGNIL